MRATPSGLQRDSSRISGVRIGPVARQRTQDEQTHHADTSTMTDTKTSITAFVPSNSLTTSRRSALGCALGIGLAVPLSSSPAAAQQDDWARTVDMQVRIRANHNGERAFYYITGDIWARRLGQLAERMLTVEACSFNKLTRLPNGNLEHKNSELGAFKDLRTGAYLGKWTNTYNGEICDAPLIGRDGVVGRAELTPTGALGGAPSTVRGSVWLGAPVIRNGSIWVTEDAAALVPRPVPVKPGEEPRMKSVSTSGLSTFSALESDVRNDKLDFVPVSLAFVEVSDWWPWMKMEPIEGFATWRLYGSKLRGPHDLPPVFTAFLEGRKPGWLANPGV